MLQLLKVSFSVDTNTLNINKKKPLDFPLLRLEEREEIEFSEHKLEPVVILQGKLPQCYRTLNKLRLFSMK